MNRVALAALGHSNTQAKRFKRFVAACLPAAAAIRALLPQALGVGSNARANPSFERTHTGVRQLAFISFWANCRTPAWAAQLKR
jgi:hypothetical protein